MCGGPIVRNLRLCLWSRPGTWSRAMQRLCLALTAECRMDLYLAGRFLFRCSSAPISLKFKHTTPRFVSLIVSLRMCRHCRYYWTHRRSFKRTCRRGLLIESRGCHLGVCLSKVCIYRQGLLRRMFRSEFSGKYLYQFKTLSRTRNPSRMNKLCKYLAECSRHNRRPKSHIRPLKSKY